MKIRNILFLVVLSVSVLSCTLTGVALSVSRIASGYQAVGEGRSIVRLIRTALILFLGLFCLLAIPFGLGRDFFARKVLGNPQTALALLLIVPCLFLTGFENVHKAFFTERDRPLPPPSRRRWRCSAASWGRWCCFRWRAASPH